MSTRFITFAFLALAAAAAWPAAAQDIEVLISELVGRDGATPYYSGTVSWTNHEGGTESVNAYVDRGQVECKGTYQDENGVRDIDGPGLMEMSLGQGNNNKYSFRVACPNATGSPVQPANFSHSFDSYEQPGGTVKLDLKTQKAKLPRVLEGSRSEPYENGGSIRMTWKLCTRGCPPPAKKQAPPP